MPDKTFRGFVNVFEKELEEQTGRYFTHHIPKNCDDVWGRGYLHETVLRHLISFKPDVCIGSCFGLFVQVSNENSELCLQTGFYIEHARFQAETFVKNLKSPDVVGQLQSLVEELEPFYDSEEARVLWSSQARYQELRGCRHNVEEEWEVNPHPIDVPRLIREYPIRNRESTGKNGGKGMYGGCDFRILHHSGRYPHYSDLVEDVPGLAEGILSEFGFLHNALFPSTFSPKRQTDQNRIMKRILDLNGQVKQCDIAWCRHRDESVETHHIIPYCRGGKDAPSNFINLCKSHHKKCGTLKGKIRQGRLVLEDGTSFPVRADALRRMALKSEK